MPIQAVERAGRATGSRNPNGSKKPVPTCRPYMHAPGTTMRGRTMPSFVRARDSSIRYVPRGVVTL